MLGDRKNGIQKWKLAGSNLPPFSMFYFNISAYCCYSVISGSTTGTLFDIECLLYSSMYMYIGCVLLS